MNKKVIITGVSGQDGSHMADYLLENTDHEIYGMVRRLSVPNHINLSNAMQNPRFKLVTGDLSDSQSIDKLVKNIKPDYFINLAAQSFVGSSWDLPEQTMDVNAIGVMRCLESIVRYVPNCRFYNAGSSEEFGDVQYTPQDEKHPLRSRSPYGASKIAARQVVKTYRDSFDLYAIQGYLFNHEGERRGEEFVTRKITKGVARIYNAIKNNQEFAPIKLGNLDAKRDWSHSKDFVDGIWKMLNQEIYNLLLKDNFNEANFHYQHDGQNTKSNLWESQWLSKNIKEYVLSSNETHTVREFIEKSFKYAHINIIDVNKDRIEPIQDLNGEQVNYTLENGKPVVVVSRKFYRPADVELLLGNSNLARQELGWAPKYTFNDLVKEMVQNDLKLS